MKKKIDTNDLFVTPAPHIYHKDSVPKIMWIVFISLIPAGIWGVVFFGIPALNVIIVSILTCVITELIFNFIRIGPITVTDGSAALTGLLLAYSLPPYVPLYIPIIASIFGIGVVKQLFGGLGYNVLNPALAGRVFVMFSWLEPMTSAKYYLPQIEKTFYFTTTKLHAAVSSATPLTILKESWKGIPQSDLPAISELFWGKVGGCIGEVSALFLIIGALWIIKRKYITWHIPVSIIGTVFGLGFIFALFKQIVILPEYGLIYNAFIYSVLHIFGGALFLGAFYMATDMVTTPLTYRGQIFIGIGIGLLTFIIRKFGAYPEGVMFAILLMNLITPLIDRKSKPKIYGWENSDG